MSTATIESTPGHPHLDRVIPAPEVGEVASAALLEVRDVALRFGSALHGHQVLNACVLTVELGVRLPGRPLRLRQDDSSSPRSRRRPADDGPRPPRPCHEAHLVAGWSCSRTPWRRSSRARDCRSNVAFRCVGRPRRSWRQVPGAAVRRGAPERAVGAAPGDGALGATDGRAFAALIAMTKTVMQQELCRGWQEKMATVVSGHPRGLRDRPARRPNSGDGRRASIAGVVNRVASGERPRDISEESSQGHVLRIWERLARGSTIAWPTSRRLGHRFPRRRW